MNGGSVNASSYYPELVTLAGNPSDPGANGRDAGGWGINNSFHSLSSQGFYYCKQFLADNPTQCMLDESASNTFANSKSASLGWSGRPKRVTLYRSRANNAENIGSEAFSGKVIDDKATGTPRTTGIGVKSADIFDLKRDN